MKQFLLHSNLILIFIAGFSGLSQAQPGNFISATLKPGSKSNSVYITLKSNTTLTGVKFSSSQFELGIPDSIIPKPGFSITSMDPTLNYFFDGAIETQNGVTYYGYGFNGDGSLTGSGTTYEKDVEYNFAEVFFSNAPPDILHKVRLMQLPNGGSTTNVNFYLANLGADVTNQPAQFYSSDPTSVSNDGNGYTGSSYMMIPMSVLPIKLSGFTANKKNQDAVLNWTVEYQDAQSSHFEIERSSNGTNFVNIGAVSLTGNSANSYTYTDRNLTASNSGRVVYYRLKMVDKDGQFTYSEIKSIKLNDRGLSINLYPNPVRNSSKLNIDLDKAGVIKVSINDALGKQISHKEFNGQKGLNQHNIDLSGVSAGSYMIKVRANNKIQSIPVIKE